MHRSRPRRVADGRHITGAPRLFLPILLPALLAVGLASLAVAHEDFVGGEVILLLNAGYTIEDVGLPEGTAVLDAYPPAALYLVSVPAGIGEHDFSDLIEDAAAVKWAEPNHYEETPEGIREMVLSATGGTHGDYIDQNAAVRVGLPLVPAGVTGAGVVVAVLDTGVDLDHPVLAGRLQAGYDFVGKDDNPDEDDPVEGVPNGVDDDADGLVDEGYGHGTMVAGIIALVAPGATIMPVRVLDDEGRGEAFNVAAGIRYAELNGAQVLNLSFGGPVEIEAIDELIENPLDAPIVVSGAGNESLLQAYFPGEMEPVLMVTALDSADVKAEFADYSEAVLVAAPGAGIRSAYPGGGWGIGYGCSFAVPFVTGEAALIRGIDPGIQPGDLRSDVEGAVDDIYQHIGNAPYQGLLGSGRIYLPAAVGSSAAVEDVAAATAPSAVSLRIRAFPNPAAGVVVLELPFDVAVDARVRAEIFDVTGRAVRTLSARGGAVRWDGRDARGEPSPAGLYLVRLEAGAGPVASGRVMLVR